ncbi:hypothetical protein JKA74_05005 [Marivirga sp. S37H4]|uniref:Uncharacterized protein n=1 Tax=Marivirga aurantiaca TaxID=2802615 RepID=A0A935C6D8_9BACT|nr:hypothetical protein [Marivirga aurantiaca]MBK6264386.1 hypothetical protein [Marivirga aurantiaca]
MSNFGTLLNEAKRLTSGSNKQMKKLLDAMSSLSEKPNLTDQEKQIINLMKSSYQEHEKRTSIHFKVVYMFLIVSFGILIYSYFNDKNLREDKASIERIREGNFPLSLEPIKEARGSKVKFGGLIDEENASVAEKIKKTLNSIGYFKNIGPRQKLKRIPSPQGDHKKIIILAEKDTLGYLESDVKILTANLPANKLEYYPDKKESKIFEYQDAAGNTHLYGKIENIKYTEKKLVGYKEEIDYPDIRNCRGVNDESIFKYTLVISTDSVTWTSGKEFQKSINGQRNESFKISHERFDFPYLIEIAAGKVCDNTIFNFSSSGYKIIVE